MNSLSFLLLIAFRLGRIPARLSETALPKRSTQDLVATAGFVPENRTSNDRPHKYPHGAWGIFHSISTGVEIATGTDFLDEPLGQDTSACRTSRKSP
jgi:hypothetical protein